MLFRRTYFLMLATTLMSSIIFGQDIELTEGKLNILGKELNGVLVPAIMENQLGNLQISAPFGSGLQIKSGDHLMMKGGNVSIDTMGDFIANKGGKLRLKSPDNSRGVIIDHSNFNEFQITLDGDPSVQLLLDGSKKRWGIFSALPDTELEILQQKDLAWSGFNGLIADKAGLTIKNKALRNVSMGMDMANDLIYVFDGRGRAFIRDTDGKFFNASNPAGLVRQNVEKSQLSTLSKIRDMNFYHSRSKSGDTGIQIIGEEVSKLFPAITTEKNGEIAICYADFGLIAIKAIQEQQIRIEQLEKQNKLLLQLMEGLNERSQSN